MKSYDCKKVYGYSKIDIGYTTNNELKVILEKKFGSRIKKNDVLVLKEINDCFNKEIDLIDDMKKAFKCLNDELSGIEEEFFIQIGLTCIKLFKQSNECSHNEKYFILSYSIFKKNNMVFHDYYVTDAIDLHNFYDVVKGSIDYIKQKKKEYRFNKNEPFVLTGNAAIKFTHEYIGHILEDDYFKISPIRNMLGQRLLNTNIHLIENYNVQDKYDDEGNEIKRNIELIKDGIIVNTLNKETGNIILNMYDDDGLIRMRSLKLFGKSVDFDIRSYNGLIIEDFSECEFSAVTGSISFIVSKSYIVENGNIKNHLDRFYIHLTISELKEKKLRVFNDYCEKYYLCGKNGQLAIVKTTAPTICIEESEENICN